MRDRFAKPRTRKCSVGSTPTSSAVRRFKIPAIVFLTGACSLIIEIAAMRILAPYFGNTIFTTSSVISVVLGALSLGYFAGGRLSEKAKGDKLFYWVILLAGGVTAAIEILSGWLLPAFGYRLGAGWGPLVCSLALFFGPSVFLGMVSPLGIKVHGTINPGGGAGKIAGDIFFWSTAGSIAGSLAAGFWLIPVWGVSRIVIGAGAALLLLGGWGLRNPIFLVLAVAVGLAGRWQLVTDGTVYDKDGQYGRITIRDVSSEKGKVRYLIQDRNTSSGMYVNTDELVFEYTKYYSVYRQFKPEVDRALFLGGGAYSIPKAFLAEQPKAVIDVVEVEPEMARLGEVYFRVPKDARLRHRTADGRRWLATAPDKYDLIFGDVYQTYLSVPAHMTTKEFFGLVRSRLTENGVFAANVIGSLAPVYPSFTFSEMRTFEEIFPNSFFLAVDTPDSVRPQNMIFVGVAGEGKKLTGYEGKMIDRGKYGLGRYPVLTDDYSPVEYLAAKMLAN